MFKKLSILLIIIILAAAVYFGYFKTRPQVQENKTPNEIINTKETQNIEDFFITEWKQIQQEFYIKEYPIYNAEHELADKVTVIKIKPDNYKYEIYQDTENVKTISQWRSELNSLLVINGGYFLEDYSPAGGLIINKEAFGTITHAGDNGYTGMLTIKDNKMDILYLPDNNYSEDQEIDFGLQSFPMIIKPNGQPGIESDSKKQAKRSIIAKDKSGNILFINTLNSTFSLFEIMQFLLNSDLEIDKALNLDGGPSSGISVETEGFKYLIESSNIPNVISVKMNE